MELRKKAAFGGALVPLFGGVAVAAMPSVAGANVIVGTNNQPLDVGMVATGIGVQPWKAFMQNNSGASSTGQICLDVTYTNGTTNFACSSVQAVASGSSVSTPWLNVSPSSSGSVVANWKVNNVTVSSLRE